MKYFSVVIPVVVFVGAWLIWSLGTGRLKIKKITARIWPLKVEMETPPGENRSSVPLSSGNIAISQRASNGGIIHKSGISVAGQDAVCIEQQAEGKGSRIDDSPVEFT